MDRSYRVLLGGLPIRTPYLLINKEDAMFNDIGTLATLQNERYNGLVHQLALLHLVRGKKQSGEQCQATASRPAQTARMSSFSALLLTLLPPRIRAIFSY